MQLTAKDIAELRVPVPPRDVQMKLAALIEAEDRAYRSALEAAKARRSLVEALIASALSGPAEEGIK
jgi:restriction endonuclease S subunit